MSNVATWGHNGQPNFFAQDQLISQDIFDPGIEQSQKEKLLQQPGWYWDQYYQPVIDQIDAQSNAAKKSLLETLNASYDAAYAPITDGYKNLDAQKVSFYETVSEYLGFKSKLNEKPVLDANGEVIEDAPFPWLIVAGLAGVFLFLK